MVFPAVEIQIFIECGIHVDFDLIMYIIISRSTYHRLFLCVVSSLLELLSCAALESAASQAVLETLVLMLSSGQVTHGHDPAESASASSPLRTRPPLAHDATCAGDSSGEASGCGSLGLPYVPYVPLVAEHTRTRRAAGFVLLSLELKFLHLCASVPCAPVIQSVQTCNVDWS